MKDLLLCKPGEIFLKGLNKHYFEERLVANVKRRLKLATLPESALYPQRAVLTLVTGLFLLLAWGIGVLVFYSLKDRR